MLRSSTAAALAALVLAGCSTAAGGGAAAEQGPSATGRADRVVPSTSPYESTAPAPTATPTPTPEPTPEPTPPYVVSDGRPRDATVSIPTLGITDLEVRTYEGWTDDAPGHAIQNTGIAASPTGPRGGTGPGGVGNYQVTGHRNSAGGIFLDTPTLTRGDRVLVSAGGTVYVYAITTTRITSFRSERSLREQRAAVPGEPGATPTQAMITISTCRTQEDHAEGNYWADEFDNPEHRIDKIGVLVRTRPA